MEEILASIRRIIESNEPDQANSELARLASMDVVEEDQGAALVDEIRLTIEDELPSFVPAARPAPQAAPQNQPVERPVAVSQVRPQPAAAVSPPLAANSPAEQPPAPRREEEARSISLADVAARVRAASERTETARVAPPAPEPETARAVELRAAPVIRPVEAIARPTSAPAQPAAEELRETRSEEPAAAPQIDSLAEAAAALMDEPVTAEERPFEAPKVDLQEQVTSLVSRETGEQVARSFHELAEMVNLTAQRSLDEIAQDLLRPMLQEWLDDNLPTLVERLVREEIERVARGPRR
ncbi:DUF2497 domain-containing protein [Gellertiella hungarica]|uniref:DUF2497 domain-containing protein n=1 Tax=Gellertiella hungarica TaxID=1572859 RepID=A0A7W6J6V6_9HYPH|nr:hypothetical protein [Gellertiella hungarica]